MLAKTPKDIGRLAGALRRGRHVRQADVALRAGVSRQWLIDLEHGKPSLDFGLVLRTLETLGIDLNLVPADPPPTWQIQIQRLAETKAYNIAWKRRKRRQERRDAARMKRLAAAGVAAEAEAQLSLWGVMGDERRGG